ncbi:thioredoxin peroxidase dot5 [Sporothrix curviconia]|uniref:thioredoxin-dependent peroxiredoxin n=1 Tax=Sporothrix curviconia TaxID=1260050 RepID=A0ABP0CRD1_9PEZI
MPMELRKRKAPETPAAPVKKAAKPKAEKAAKPEKAEKTKKTEKPAGKAAKAATTKAAPAKKPKDTSAPAPPFPEVGSTIDLEGFGGSIQTNDGTTTTLKELVEASKAGVVLFTYPKASTPGCTKQACLFRDKYTPLTAGGLAIYGLSHDTLEANTKFKTNQNLPYPLLCDPEQTLIGAIGLRKSPISTAVRGVFVVDKSGKVLAAEAGSPDGTVATVQKIVEESK